MPIRKELLPLYKTEKWKAARQRCKERAEDRCQQCGASNGTFVMLWRGGKQKRVKIQCGAAHLNNTPGDDRDANLKWLCRGCHLHRDAPHHKQTRAARKDRGRPVIQAATAPYQVTVEQFIEETKAKETIYEE